MLYLKKLKHFKPEKAKEISSWELLYQKTLEHANSSSFFKPTALEYSDNEQITSLKMNISGYVFGSVLRLYKGELISFLSDRSSLIFITRKTANLVD